jgi:hypothetical protein
MKPKQSLTKYPNPQFFCSNFFKCALLTGIIQLLQLIIFDTQSHAQTFYAVTTDDLPVATRTFELNINNCDTPKISTCPPTQNILQLPENQYSDMAIDGDNIYWVSAWGSLYTRNINNPGSCQYLGKFDGNLSVNSMTADAAGNIYATGNNAGVCILFKYNITTTTFSTIGNLPAGFFSAGDLFFFEGKLFMTCTDNFFSSAFLIEVNTSNPQLSCYYMPLQNLQSWGAFAINQGAVSKAYIGAVVNFGTNNYTTTLYEINMVAKTIGPPLCTYPFNITGMASNYNYSPANTSPCGTVPVLLSQFGYSIAAGTIKLQWTTAAETNSAYYLIERSTDSIHFIPIGQVGAAGQSNALRNYTFTDKTPAPFNYYRLKQVDKDGRYTYSKTVRVKMPYPAPLQVTGNPVGGRLSVRLHTGNRAAIAVYLFDISGRKIKSFQCTDGYQLLDTGSLPLGSYVLTTCVNGKMYKVLFTQTDR